MECCPTYRPWLRARCVCTSAGFVCENLGLDDLDSIERKIPGVRIYQEVIEAMDIARGAGVMVIGFTPKATEADAAEQ